MSYAPAIAVVWFTLGCVSLAGYNWAKWWVSRR